MPRNIPATGANYPLPSQQNNPFDFRPAVLREKAPCFLHFH